MIASEELLNNVLTYYAANNVVAIRKLFKETPEVDIADVLSEVSLAECVVLFRLVSKVEKIAVFSYLTTERKVELIGELPEAVNRFILNEMDPDDRTAFVEEVPDDLKIYILNSLDPEEREIAKNLLSYEEGSVGRLMTPDFVPLMDDLTVSQALEIIRWSNLIPTENLHHLFITNRKGELVGELDLASMVLADPPTVKINEIMDKATTYLHPEQEEADAVEILRRYETNIIPVVNSSLVLIGIVTSDDVFDVAEEDATEAIQQFGGQGALEESYFETTLFQMVKKRIGWLILLFFGTMLTGTALKHYDRALEDIPFFIFFLALIVSAGGNTGTQAASLVLRGLAINEMNASDWGKVLSRELLVGLCLGAVLGAAGYLRAYAWGYGAMICTIVAVTLVSIVLLGTIAGSMLPLAISKTKFDPSVISSPFIATLLDITGTVIFINITLLFFKYFNLY